MYCSQNSKPAARKLPCISQMCTAWLFSPKSNRAGTCQAIITALKRTTDTQGRSRTPLAARSGRDQPPARALRVAARPRRAGSAASSGCHGAPATIIVGAANISNRCWIMCTKK